MERKEPQRVPVMRIVRHEFSLRSIFSLLAIAAGIWLLALIWQIILLLVIALILAGTLNPILAWFERHNVPRTIALSLVLVVLVLAIAGLGALVLPTLVTQIGILITNAPAIQTRLADYLASIPLLARSATSIRSAQPAQFLEPLAASALTSASAAATVVVLGLTTIVLASYLLADPQRVKGFAFALLPRRFHLRAARILLEMEMVVGGYVRGQALTSLLIGVFVFVVLWAFGASAPLAIGIVAAFADLLPFVGGALVLVPAVLVALPLGLLPTVIIAVLIIAYLQVESHVLIPRIYAQTLRLSSLAVVIAILIGGQLLGIVGALLALPVAAGVRVLVEQLRIELPGEQPGESTQRTLDAVAETAYAQQTEGISAIDAVAVATVMAEQAQEDTQAATDRVEQPIEEQSDGSSIAPQLPIV